MVWSLSKDDDGLDSVLPLADAPLAPSRSSVAVGARSTASDATPLGASPTVVVDPISQVPEGFGVRPAGKQVVEPTLVLKGRKLDQLRAEVARHRTAHQRKKQKALLLWAGAGALALCLGWAVGTAFRPNDAQPVQEPPASQSSGTESAGSEPAEPSAPAAPGLTPPAERSPASVDWADLPAEDEAEKGRGSSAEPSSDAFTLDDLPVD